MSSIMNNRLPVNSDKIVLGKNLQFPAYGTDSLVSQVLFVTGKRGSGKIMDHRCNDGRDESVRITIRLFLMLSTPM